MKCCLIWVYTVKGLLGGQERCSGESTRLPPMWPGFKSQRRHHMWVEFVVGSLLWPKRFFSGYSGFPLSSKTNISKFQFDQESGRRRTTLWMCSLQIIIYIFIYLLTFWPLEMPSKQRYKIFTCSVILAELESFRNYKGFSIFSPKILQAM